MSTGPSAPRPTLNVFFAFDKRWEIGPASGDEVRRVGGGASIPDIVQFPPGGGPFRDRPSWLDFEVPPGCNVGIEPLDLTGQSDAEIARTLVRRAGAIALVAQAIAIAQADLAAAVAALER